MLRLASYDIVFQEVPGEVTLALNLSGCPNRCEGCHSPHLREDIGQPLDDRLLAGLLDSYGSAVTCVCFMGGDAEPDEVERFSLFVRQHTCRSIGTCLPLMSGDDTEMLCVEKSGNKKLGDEKVLGVDESVEIVTGVESNGTALTGRSVVSRLKTAWYSGRRVFPESCSPESFDYVKLGPYIPERGGLRSYDTNQRMYKILHGRMVDITWMFNR